jgi:hypothetical protein
MYVNASYVLQYENASLAGVVKCKRSILRSHSVHALATLRQDMR